ncbi:kinase-like domain-containing protein [Rhizophagus diaphanus]|nr:kinase-like domain-containing protein [Rhizophagus diaphanus] [Rhizophagus sp. MUCL 43196]
MANSSESKVADTNEWTQLIEDAITNDFINYYDYNEFQNLQHIGSGVFGKVYHAAWKSQGTIVALKSFEFNNCIMKEIFNEIQLLRKVNFHKNIIQLFGIIKRKNSDKNMDSDYLFILEYADGVTLKNYLENNFYKLDWNIKLQFAIQIADAVLCIHQNDIIHCDLNSHNILVHQNTVKLADLGISRRIAEVSSHNNDTFGTRPTSLC